MNKSSKAVLLAIFLLGEATIVAAQTRDNRSGDDEERLICRRMPETGSLVRSRRQCFTKAEWDRIAHSQQEGAEKTIMGLTTRPAGN